MKNMKIDKKGIVIIGLVIIAIIVFAFSGVDNRKENTKNKNNETGQLETRLEKILSGVKGAGNVEVMIVFKDSGRENIAMNTKYSEDGDGRSSSEQTAVVSSGKEPIVVQKNIPQVQGVIVTAQGAEDETVRENLKKAVEAVLPVLPHRIEVLPQE